MSAARAASVLLFVPGSWALFDALCFRIKSARIPPLLVLHPRRPPQLLGRLAQRFPLRARLPLPRFRNIKLIFLNGHIRRQVAVCLEQAPLPAQDLVHLVRNHVLQLVNKVAVIVVLNIPLGPNHPTRITHSNRDPCRRWHRLSHPVLLLESAAG